MRWEGGHDGADTAIASFLPASGLRRCWTRHHGWRVIHAALAEKHKRSGTNLRCITKKIYGPENRLLELMDLNETMTKVNGPLMHLTHAESILLSCL